MIATATEPATNEIQIDLKKTECVDWSLKIVAESNKVSGGFAYTDKFEGWFSRAPTLNSAHPDVPALKLTEISPTRQDGGLVKVSLSYECNDPDATYPGREKGKIKRYSIEPTEGEEPLLTFHKLVDLIDASKEAIGQLLSSSRTPADFAAATAAIGADPLALFAVDKIRDSRETYLDGGLVWVERFMTKDLNDLELSKHLKIYADPPGDPPTLPEGCNWLYKAGPAAPQDDGESWEIEKRWFASNPGGWDDWFYGEDEEP
jgi:hypothetical protein